MPAEGLAKQESRSPVSESPFLVSSQGDCVALWNQRLLEWGQQEEAPPVVFPGSKIISLVANKNSFAMALDDGELIAWGGPFTGGMAPDRSLLEPLQAEESPTRSSGEVGPRSILSITPSDYAFAALLDDGTILSWGNSFPDHQGHLLIPPDNKKAVSIVANADAFAALLDDGSLLCWGKKSCGGIAPAINESRVVAVASPFHQPVSF